MRASALTVSLLLSTVWTGALAVEDAKGNRPTLARPEMQEPPVDVDPSRFGAKPEDAAYGAFQRGLYITALNLALPRAREGDPAAQTLVAEIYSRGLGVPRNPAEAASWYARAAQHGVPEAQFQYALMLIDGRHAEKNLERAYELMQSAADAGNRLAQFNLAQMILTRRSGTEGVERALAYYEKAARAGLADAQYAMAHAYATGLGGRPVDDTRARRWLVLAARQNYDTAQLDLGTWLVEGRGGERDEEAGFSWLKRAAESGNVAAQNRLAKLYRNAIGNEGDPVLAAAWYFVARRAGLKDPEMEDFLRGLDEAQTREALENANRLR